MLASGGFYQLCTFVLLAAVCAAINNISKLEAGEQLQNTLLEARTSVTQSSFPSNAAAR